LKNQQLFLIIEYKADEVEVEENMQESMRKRVMKVQKAEYFVKYNEVQVGMYVL